MSARSKNAGGGAVLSLANLSKRFGGTQAVNDVGFDIGRGEILALLGENGAGKSTLIKMLAGVYPADAGTFEFHGQTFDPRQGHPSLAFIHQDLGLIEWMTVSENISLMEGRYPRRFGLIDWQAARSKAVEALALVSEELDPEARVQDLTRTEKSLVAIARALARDAELLVLDEPTASLPQSDVVMLHGVLSRLRQNGVAMIYVSHRLDEVFAIADRVVVMRDGFKVADEPIGRLNGERLVELIIGRKFKEVFVRPPVDEKAPVVLRLEDVRVNDVGPVSLSLRRGEVLGLVGLRGAGQDAVGHALFGRNASRSGRILLSDGSAFSSSHPLDSIRSGIAMVAGDRNAESVARGLTVQENLFLNPSLTGRPLFGFERPGSERQVAKSFARIFDIRPDDPSVPIETLSGGNQQKVVMARWMQAGADILILEDPTAGVDVGSKADIYVLIAKALADGLAVLLISTDFEEVAGISHRAIVFRDGQIAVELKGEQLTIGELLNAASLETQNFQTHEMRKSA